VSTGYSTGGQGEPWSCAENYDDFYGTARLALLILMFLASILGYFNALRLQNLTASGGCTPWPP